MIRHPELRWITKVFRGVTPRAATADFNEWFETVEGKMVRAAGIYYLHVTHVRREDHYELHVTAYGDLMEGDEL